MLGFVYPEQNIGIVWHIYDSKQLTSFRCTDLRFQKQVAVLFDWPNLTIIRNGSVDLATTDKCCQHSGQDINTKRTYCVPCDESTTLISSPSLNRVIGICSSFPSSSRSHSCSVVRASTVTLNLLASDVRSLLYTPPFGPSLLLFFIFATSSNFSFVLDLGTFDGSTDANHGDFPPAYLLTYFPDASLEMQISCFTCSSLILE